CNAERLRIAPYHDRQLTALRPGLPSRYGRIEEAGSTPLRFCFKFPREFRRCGRMVDQHRAAANSRERTAVAIGDASHVVVVADTHEDDIGAARRNRRRLAYFARIFGL